MTTISASDAVRTSVEKPTPSVDALSVTVDAPSVTAPTVADSGALPSQHRGEEGAVRARPVDVDGTLRAFARQRIREESEPVAGAHAISRALRGDIDLGEDGRVHVVAKRIEAALAVSLDAELGETARVLAASAPTLAAELRSAGAATPRVTVNGPDTSSGSFASGDRSSRDGGSSGNGSGDGASRGGRDAPEQRVSGVGRRRVRIVL